MDRSLPGSIIRVIGMGASGIESVSPEVAKWVAAATVWVGSNRLLTSLATARPDWAARVARWPLGNFEDVVEQVRSHLSLHPDAQIVVLASGDPLFFGIGRYLLSVFEPATLAFYPNVSAMQLAFSRLKLPWQDAVWISVHGRAADALVASLKRGDAKIAVLTDAQMTPGAIARLIQSLNVPVRYDLWVGTNLGAGDETMQQFSLEAAANSPDLAAQFFSVVVLLKHPDQLPEPDQLPVIGLPDTAFVSFADRPALMTKRAVRLLAIGEMALMAGQVVWDVGAGTGSVSVEMSRLCPSTTIYAIEKSAMGVQLIRENARRYAIAPVHVVHSKALEVIDSLPLPARVFIGGSSGELTAILDTLAARWEEACALAVDGVNTRRRVVLAIATLEHLATAVNWLQHEKRTDKWQSQVAQVNISQSVPVGSLTRLMPLNPVYLVTLELKSVAHLMGH